jgi:hypothetical protein
VIAKICKQKVKNTTTLLFKLRISKEIRTWGRQLDIEVSTNGS